MEVPASVTSDLDLLVRCFYLISHNINKTAHVKTIKIVAPNNIFFSNMFFDLLVIIKKIKIAIIDKGTAASEKSKL